MGGLNLHREDYQIMGATLDHGERRRPAFVATDFRRYGNRVGLLAS